MSEDRRNAPHGNAARRPSARVMAAALASLMTVGVAVPEARASERTALRMPEAASRFWWTLRRPNYRVGRMHFAEGRERYRFAQMLQRSGASGPGPQAALREAIVRLQRAHLRAPEDPEILLYLGLATSKVERTLADGTVRRRTAEAIGHLRRLAAMAPDYETNLVQAELGVLLTRQNDYAGAAEAYLVAIDAALIDAETAIPHLNLAEVLMLAGHLRRAVHHYERAEAISLESRASALDSTVTLARFGLAIATDRLDDHARAIEHAHRGDSHGRGLALLHDDSGVFFEPAYEIHWYDALAYEARAAHASSPASRFTQLRAAVSTWHRFVVQSDGESPFHDLAVRREQEARVALEAARAARDAEE